jgi:hypothetical protein
MQRTHVAAPWGAAAVAACSARMRWPHGGQVEQQHAARPCGRPLGGGRQGQQHAARACGRPLGGGRDSSMQRTCVSAPWGRQEQRHAAHACGGPSGCDSSSGMQRPQAVCDASTAMAQCELLHAVRVTAMGVGGEQQCYTHTCGATKGSGWGTLTSITSITSHSRRARGTPHSALLCYASSTQFWRGGLGLQCTYGQT